MKRITFYFLTAITFPIWAVASCWHLVFEAMVEWHDRISEQVRKEESKK